MKKKVGRNEPCPCGSGKKYKKCHGITIQPSHTLTPSEEAEIKQKFKQLKALDMQRIKQQGKGKPIISALFKGYRLVAVGNRFHYSKDWKTFADFLFYYLKFVFGTDWGNTELKKDFGDRHPVVQWYDYVCKEQKKFIKQEGVVATATMTGAVYAYFILSYNLYLLAHNAKLHAYFVERLRNNDLFYPAFYETIMAASFIKAGFTIELEDETDSTSDHAEFIAISPKTSRKYSVEAKHRRKGKNHFGVRRQLDKALTKNLPHERVIFIDLNVPENVDSNGRVKWLGDVLQQLRSHENSLINGKPAPPAYVFVTNHPFLYNLDSYKFSPAAVAEGFKIPDFKIDYGFSNLREALKSREKHIDILDLMQAMKEYDRIPATFDGEIPEYAFEHAQQPRLIIGNKYLVPTNSGQEVSAILRDAVVCGEEISCVYELENGHSIITRCPMTEQEKRAYNQHSDTFFGVYKKTPSRTKDALDFFDFFYNSYKNSSKEKLLEFLKDAPDYDILKNETQKELAITYCERLVYSIPLKNPAGQMGHTTL